MTQFTKVESSNIAAIGYDPANEQTGTLVVRFKSGATYAYTNVPSEIYQAMQTAESVGRFLNEHIKSEFDGTKLETKED